MAEKLLSLEQVAEELNVSIDTIRRLGRRADQHRLPMLKVLNSVRVRRKDLDQWVERQLQMRLA